MATNLLSIDFNLFTGSGFNPTPAPGQLDSDLFSIAGFSDGDLAFGGTAETGDYARGFASGGNVTFGGIYSFDLGDGDFALGIQPAGSDFTPGSITIQVENTTGALLNEVSVNYDIVVFNDQNRSNSLNFSYSTDDTLYTPISALDFVTPEEADGTPSFALTDRSVILTGLNIAAGDSLYLRFDSDDVGGSASRDEIGLDNITVSLLDGLDNVVVDLATDEDDGDYSLGDLSLREALGLVGDGGTITFANSIANSTIALGSELIIDKAVTIDGTTQNITLSGGNTTRIFNINDGTGTIQTVNLSNLTLTNAAASDDGGAISNNENLTLRNSTVRDSTSVDDGGGILNRRVLTIVNSTLENNAAQGTSPFSGGGALINVQNATATIVNSTIANNTARNGGGIRNDGDISIINSTLSGNTATTSGGGLVNTIDPFTPGAIGVVNIKNSTITNNTGGGLTSPGILTSANSIIAGNVANADLQIDSATGFATSGGNNLIGNGDDASAFSNGVNGDIVGSALAPVDPGLRPLADNGGFTQTHSLEVGSLAIDAGNAAGLPIDTADVDGDGDTSEVLPIDQRGATRVQASVLDIGAYESLPPVIIPDPNDLDGNGTADLFWRSESTRDNRIFLMNGPTVTANTSVLGINSAYQAAGTGDFNNDGKLDIFWRNPFNGFNRIFLMDGTNRLLGNRKVLTINNSFDIVDVADFNGDGNDDVLWRNAATGYNRLFTLNGTTLTGNTKVLGINPAFNISEVGDFNGDGKADVFWRDAATGNNRMFLMDGTNPLLENSKVLGISNAFDVIQVADFDGDGKDDLFWRNSTTGDNRMFLMDGTTVSNNSKILGIDAGFNETIVGDFDGNTTDDLLFRNTSTGENRIFLMNGTTVTANNGIVDLSPDFDVVKVADFNGDGKDDIFARNEATGTNRLLEMDGTTVIGNNTVLGIGSDFTLVSPR